MSNEPNFELLKDAYEIVDGIPAENFNLNQWRKKDRGMSCGTIACAAGWLSLHPKFQALGLGYRDFGIEGYQVTFGDEYHFAALAELFNIGNTQAHVLFGSAHEFEPEGHKAEFLKPVRVFLQKHGQLKEQIARRERHRSVIQRSLSR
jgi:hypothetical protein